MPLFYNKKKEGIKKLLALLLVSSSSAFQTLHFGLRPSRSPTSIDIDAFASKLNAPAIMQFMSLATDAAEEQSGAIATETATLTEPSLTSIRKSLASSFVVDMGQPFAGNNFQWTFSPIDQINLGKQIKGGVGAGAIHAMQTPSIAENDPFMMCIGSFKLSCQVEIENSRITVEAEIPPGDASDDDDLETLAAILSRVMIQSAAATPQFKNGGDVTIVVPSVNNSKDRDAYASCTETYALEDLTNPSGYAQLFAAVLPSNCNLNDVEMSNMVDSDGEPCGYLPRPLVHKFNILHRGIGVVVCKDGHIAKIDYDTRSSSNNNNNNSKSRPGIRTQVYVHQRTDTKRIFPSLYDMFVGGVATAGESLKLTAKREVGEELNLTRPGSLSDPLFRCTICTSYNRCVVTVYTYNFDSSSEEVSWQEEEVQWGDFVEYDIVERSSALSIGRLLEANAWPGKDDDAMSMSILVTKNKNPVNTVRIDGEDGATSECSREEGNWDYVPDGLLVWVAWLQWLSK